MFCHVKGFCRKCQEFSISEKMHLQTFLYGNHPNDSHILKVIDKIMVHSMVMKIQKNKNKKLKTKNQKRKMKSHKSNNIN